MADQFKDNAEAMHRSNQSEIVLFSFSRETNDDDDNSQIAVKRKLGERAMLAGSFLLLDLSSAIVSDMSRTN